MPFSAASLSAEVQQLMQLTFLHNAFISRECGMWGTGNVKRTGVGEGAALLTSL